MLFLVVEVTRLLSNLIKSGFVAFSQDNTLVIDANKNKIIKGLDAAEKEVSLAQEDTVEEALAEAMILDAELSGEGFDDDILTMDTASLPDISDSAPEELQQMADEMLASAKGEADSIINRAYDEVEKLRGAAYDEAEQIKKQAEEDGYQQGYAKGMEAAENTINEKEAALKQRMQEVEIQLQEKEAELVKVTEKQMVDLLCQFIPQITGIVIEDQREVLFYIINSAMRDLDNSRHFVIKVSCDDYEAVSERKEEIYGALNPNIQLEVFEDAKLSPMQCLIETDNGIVDVSLDVQLDNLIKALRLMIKE